VVETRREVAGGADALLNEFCIFPLFFLFFPSFSLIVHSGTPDKGAA
jgi:hypothetical protein